MSKNVRNLLTLIVGLTGGFYLGENLPEVYYLPMKKKYLDPYIGHQNSN